MVVVVVVVVEVIVVAVVVVVVVLVTHLPVASLASLLIPIQGHEGLL